jgi:hypothetical protein
VATTVWSLRSTHVFGAGVYAAVSSGIFGTDVKVDILYKPARVNRVRK